MARFIDKSTITISELKKQNKQTKTFVANIVNLELIKKEKYVFFVVVVVIIVYSHSLVLWLPR